MKRLIRQTLHLALAIGLSVTLWLAWSDTLWARIKRDAAKPPQEPTYAMDYIVVLIMVGLGLAVICRPNFRGGGEDDS